MQMVSQVMTRNVSVVAPHESIQRAAQMMDELNVGSLPVCDGQRLVGVVTDRDITVRATAAGRAPGDAHVDEVMSTDVRWCFEDDEIDEVARKMADTQIRRVPVVSHDEQRRLVGIVALGDLLTRGQVQQAAGAAARISTPAAPDRTSGGTPARQETGGYDPRVSGITGEGGMQQASYAAGSEVGADLGELTAESTGSGAGNLADQGITAPQQAGGSAGKGVKNSGEVERPEDGRKTGGRP